MRIQISLESFQKSIELDSWQENTTLRQIVYTAGGPEIAADDPLYVDSQPVTGDTTMDTVVLLEGSTIGYAPTPVAEPIHGWSIPVAGGLHAALPADEEALMAWCRAQLARRKQEGALKV